MDDVPSPIDFRREDHARAWAAQAEAARPWRADVRAAIAELLRDARHVLGGAIVVCDHEPMDEREQYDALASAGFTEIATHLRPTERYYLIAAVRGIGRGPSPSRQTPNDTFTASNEHENS
jgi:hypothetical protein